MPKAAKLKMLLDTTNSQMSLPAFKRHLKTHFFQSAYPTP